MPRRVNTIELSAVNGTLDLTTERGCTHLSAWTTPGKMCAVIDNTTAARRFLRAAIKRMERDAKATEPR